MLGGPRNISSDFMRNRRFLPYSSDAFIIRFNTLLKGDPKLINSQFHQYENTTFTFTSFLMQRDFKLKYIMKLSPAEIKAKRKDGYIIN